MLIRDRVETAEGHWLLIFKRASVGVARLRALNARSSSVSADRLLLKYGQYLET